MLKALVDQFTKLLFLSRDTNRNTADIESLKVQLADLTQIVQNVANEFHEFKQTERLERGKANAST
jgi:hypothetical protein